ncbi:ammonium transporter Rh type A-like [Xenia sp. Carnegie-2017]|uniref:ammonium transporter Rh type A-like n=1 Tax=Xenia sp. Carnegie-2017 TaxID=2897299 RepID=UPI001F033DC3|nr:ammonium transporter Rh type A-like [Xenia sp. Carnegie-2017]
MKVSLLTAFFQVLLIILFATLVKYDPKQSGAFRNKNNLMSNNTSSSNQISRYPVFQDVHVMIFVGFGFLMTFLKNYGYSAIGYNFFLSSLAIQWYIIIAGCIEHRETTDFTIDLNLEKLITADFSAAAVLITFGVLLGKVSRLQLFLICIIEIVVFTVNEFILLEELKIADAGGSLVIHCFGCYFGLAVSFMLRNVKNEFEDNDKEGSVYHSDLFSMIGTLFLWMYWPSFNSALVTDPYDQQRTVINTYLSLVACCVTTFAVSAFVHQKRKLNMVHVQNATLAGGVAIGTVANMIVEPWGALFIGTLAGVVSVLGYSYVTPFLSKFLKIHDTCGVNNLHGMPALVAGLAGVIYSRMSFVDDYHESLTNVFEARENRTEHEQSIKQLVAIFVTLAISIGSGLITGFIISFKIFDAPSPKEVYDDESYWVMPSNDPADDRTAPLDQMKKEVLNY